jgi:hypothetical protein
MRRSAVSRTVHDRLRELQTEVRNLQVLPAAAVRARGRRRARRQLAALTAAGVAVAATASVAFTWPHQRTVPVSDQPPINCVLARPDSPAEVQVRVLDGGAPVGLPAATVSQLRARGFTVLDGTTDTNPVGAAALRYGPAAIGAAALLRAEVYGETTMRFDPDRRDRTVDLTVGPAFTRLATATELNQSLVAADQPSAPTQCSRAPGR